MLPVRSVFPSILPKSRIEWALYAFVLLCAVRPWLLGWIMFPHDPAAVRVIYRSPSGDMEYFPMINALAKGNFGESAIYESHGTGILSFPVASVLYHVVGTALFGPLVGYIVADIAVTFLFFFAFRFWCRLFSPHELWTSFLAALYTSGFPQIIDGFGFHLVHFGEIWGERIPRPFVSDVYLLAGIGLLTWMIWKPENRKRISSWMMLGAIMALNLQSLIYPLPALGLAAAFMAMQWIWEDKYALGLVFSRICISAVTFIVLGCPFLLQRAFESPEEPARLGLYSVDRWDICVHTPWAMDPCVLAGFIFLGLLAQTNSAARQLNLPTIPGRVLGLLATMQFAAFLGIPLTAIVTGHLIQEYHFPLVTAAVQTCLFVAWMARFFPSFLPPFLYLPLPAGIILAFGYCLLPYHDIHRHLLVDRLRTDMYSPPGPDYHHAFASLARELDRDTYKDDKVMATLDDQIFSYWVGFLGRSSFLPKSWNTTLSNYEMEDRLLWLARNEGLDQVSLSKFLDQHTIATYWFDGDIFYHPSPYKIQEMQSRYTQILSRDKKEMPRLDLIVLSADTKLFPLPDPDPAHYALTYHDDYFRVWKVIKPVP